MSSIAASIPFLGNVLSPNKDAINKDNKTADEDAADGDGVTKSHGDLESGSGGGDSPRAEEDEDQNSRNAAAAAGGAGAAALVMSRGLQGITGLTGGGDRGGESSDTSSQHHNYLPSDLGGAKGLVGDGNPPRELQGPVSTNEGAFDSASRDKDVPVNKPRGGINIDDGSEDLTDEEEHRRRQNRIFAMLAFCWCCLILLAVLATLLAVYLGDDDDDDGTRAISPPDVVFTMPPSPAPTISPVPTVTRKC